MIYYFSFCLLCLAVGIFENWDSGIDLTWRLMTALLFESLVPIMNIMFLFSSLAELIERKCTGVILKGRK